VFLLAFVMSAVFLGRLTSSMTQLHMLGSKDSERIQVLKRYLRKNEISSVLSMRVQHNAQHALAERHRFMEEDEVELLGVVSDPLRAELHFELYAPVLAVHPFFASYVEACPQVLRKVCHSAMSQLLVSSGDVVFMPGEVPTDPRMLVICSGRLRYQQLMGQVMSVEVGGWISEAVLWTGWTYRGMLTATSDCRLCVLRAAKFREIAETFEHTGFNVRSYAKAFVAGMNSGQIDISDLPFDDKAEDLLGTIRELTVREDKRPSVQTLQSLPVESLRLRPSRGAAAPKGGAWKKSVLMGAG